MSSSLSKILKRINVKDAIYLSVFAIIVFLIVKMMFGGIFGLSLVVIENGPKSSMWPTYDQGDMFLINRCSPEKIEMGDVIVYESANLYNSGILIIHRVINITIFEDALGTHYYYRVSGDNPITNNNVDNYNTTSTLIPYDAVLGKTVLLIPKIGYIRLWMTSFPAVRFIILGALVIFGLYLIFTPDKEEAKKAKDAAQKDKEKNICLFCKNKIEKTDDQDLGVCSSCGKTTPLCEICKDPMTSNQSLLQAEVCEHIYHEEHILEWLKIKGTCPVCKVEINEKTLKTWEGPEKNENTSFTEETIDKEFHNLGEQENKTKFDIKLFLNNQWTKTKKSFIELFTVKQKRIKLIIFVSVILFLIIAIPVIDTLIRYPDLATAIDNVSLLPYKEYEDESMIFLPFTIYFKHDGSWNKVIKNFEVFGIQNDTVLSSMKWYSFYQVEGNRTLGGSLIFNSFEFNANVTLTIEIHYSIHYRFGSDRSMVYTEDFNLS
jgi:signal peptidase I